MVCSMVCHSFQTFYLKVLNGIGKGDSSLKVYRLCSSVHIFFCEIFPSKMKKTVSENSPRICGSFYITKGQCIYMLKIVHSF